VEGWEAGFLSPLEASPSIDFRYRGKSTRIPTRSARDKIARVHVSVVPKFTEGGRKSVHACVYVCVFIHPIYYSNSNQMAGESRSALSERSASNRKEQIPSHLAFPSRFATLRTFSPFTAAPCTPDRRAKARASVVTSNEVARRVFGIPSCTRRRTILLLVLFLVPSLEDENRASFSAGSSFKHLIPTYFHAFHADGIERPESEFPKFPLHRSAKRERREYDNISCRKNNL